VLQALVLNRGGTVETYFAGARATSCTVSVYSGDGALIVDEATCTLDEVNTTISSMTTSAAGLVDATLASATGVTPGRRYLVDSQEVVGVKELASSVARLWGPVAFTQGAGSTFQGMRVSYDVAAASCSTLWWDGYAVFTPTSGEQQTETVDCVRRRIPENLIDLTDVYQVLPKAKLALSVELDLFRALREARDQLLIDLGGKNRAHTILGVDHFRRPAAIKFWLLRRFEMGEEWDAQMTALEKEYDRIVADIISQAPVDADQDGATNGPNDRGFTSIVVERA
jgi:hypothetical protein